jgi:hypothetical protein
LCEANFYGLRFAVCLALGVGDRCIKVAATARITQRFAKCGYVASGGERGALALEIVQILLAVGILLLG